MIGHGDLASFRNVKLLWRVWLIASVLTALMADVLRTSTRADKE